MIRLPLSSILLSSLSLLIPIYCEACPTVNSLQDFNCDGKVQITVVGDSVPYGIGDTPNHDHGGYVLRVESQFPKVIFKNRGKLHLRTKQLLKDLSDTFDRGKNGSFRNDLRESDLIILDVGRNDRVPAGDPYTAFRNLRKATLKIKSEVEALEGAAPMVVKAVEIFPNSGAQIPWVSTLNSLILKSNTPKNPGDLRFDLMPKKFLSPDRLHPSPSGYATLARILAKYLIKKATPRMISQRPDTDGDDLPDIFEESRWNTDPENADTDGDGKSDGVEVFKTGTDPKVAD